MWFRQSNMQASRQNVSTAHFRRSTGVPAGVKMTGTLPWWLWWSSHSMTVICIHHNCGRGRLPLPKVYVIDNTAVLDYHCQKFTLRPRSTATVKSLPCGIHSTPILGWFLLRWVVVKLHWLTWSTLYYTQPQTTLVVSRPAVECSPVCR